MLYNKLNDFEPDHDGIYRNSPQFEIAKREWEEADRMERAVDNTTFEVFCNPCNRAVPVLEILHRTDFPSVGDLTHWHHGHDIVAD